MLDDLAKGELFGAAASPATIAYYAHQHPDAGPYVQMRPPVKYSATPANIRRHPPRLGQHTDEVLAEVEEKDAAE